MKRLFIKNALLKRSVLITVFSVCIFLVKILSFKFPLIATSSSAAFYFLIIVLLSAFLGDMIVGISISIVATLCFDYFYLPPVGTFTIEAFPDIIALVAFLLTSIIISRLTASAAENASNAKNNSNSLSGLNNFGAWLVSTTDEQLTLSKIAQKALEIFNLEYCSVHAYGDGKWNHFSGTAAHDISQEIEKIGQKYLQDHSTNVMEFAEENIFGVRYAQVNINSIPQALLAIKSDTLPSSVMKSIVHLIGLRLMKASNKIDSSNSPNKYEQK